MAEAAKGEIIRTPPKGPYIANWRGPTGTFDFLGLSEDDTPLAIYHTESVTLVDDKPRSFQGLPEDCKKVLIRRPGEPALLNQGGDQPPDLTIVRTLDELGVREAMIVPKHEHDLDIAKRLKVVKFVPLSSVVDPVISESA